MNSIATGSAFIFNVQAASQGAGQILPVNSGKLFVACNCAIAFFQSPLETKSFQSGIRFLMDNHCYKTEHHNPYILKPAH